MSIAVCAFVRPSRTARRLALGWGLAHCAAAVAVALAPLHFGAAPWLAALLALGGLILVRAALRPPKTHRIDISGTGELRVTVQQDVRAPRPVRRSADGAGAADDAPLALLPGSVRWPGLMVLRLGAPAVRPHRAPQALLIWRDSVDSAAWRPLAVALGVIGRPGRVQDGSDTKR